MLGSAEIEGYRRRDATLIVNASLSVSAGVYSQGYEEHTGVPSVGGSPTQ